MPTNSTNYKIKKPGWYLLSGLSGESINEIIDHYYPKYTYLDISQAYVPLSKDIKNIDLDARNIVLGDGPNEVTQINANDLVFNQTIGEVPSNDEFDKNLVGFINNFDTALGDNTGVWVLIAYTNDATNSNVSKLHISISNELQLDFRTLIGYDDDLDLSFNTDADLNITVERTFEFNDNMITATPEKNDASLNITLIIFSHQAQIC